jgi:hypothetical protein
MKAQDSRVQQWGVIAKNKDEYVKLAMKLASDIPALQNLRLSLQKLMSISFLMKQTLTLV